MKNIILASTSPRRKELMALTGLDFITASPTCEEIMDDTITMEENIKNIAYEKASSVFEKNKDSIVIGVDTIVSCSGEVFLKPKDEKDARRMFLAYSGKYHDVLTGMCFISREKKITLCLKSKVKFKELSQEEIETYIKTPEPYDKAGAYGIQGKASVFIEEIQGCYYNIMGLSVNKVYTILKEEFNL